MDKGILGGNTFITIWNRYDNKFYRHHIKFLCRHTTKSILNNRGHSQNMSSSISNISILRIPLLSNYINPIEWQSNPDKELYFTVQPEDYVGIGIFEYEIGDISVVELKERLGSLFFKVQNVNYSLQSHLGKHIRAEGL